MSKLSPLKTLLIHFLSLLVTLSIADASPVLAQYRNQSSFSKQFKSLSSQKPRRRARKKPLARLKLIGSTQGLAARLYRQPALCPKGEPMMAIATNADFTLTNSEHPTFWVYVPYSLTQEREKFLMKFVLQEVVSSDEKKNKDVYQATFSSPEKTTPGIIGFSLPPRESALKVGKTYRWYFLVYCDDQAQDYEPAYVEGLIQRSSDSALNNQLDQVEPLERSFIYYENRMWYDALTQIAEVWQINPNDSLPEEAWAEVLQGLGFKRMSEKGSRHGSSQGFNTLNSTEKLGVNPLTSQPFSNEGIIEIAEEKIVGRYVLPPSDAVTKAASP